ncbi:MAG: indole-3-glycerol phosphate synthase TrpC [Cyclobacteriaceae bacterium]|nr:indole-3-glycerol phosphate synthase TrpC [Cyclobacteriaceae bacterium]
MDKLTEIINHKKREVETRKGLYPVRLLEQSIFFPTKSLSLKHYIKREDKSGIIAEIKRKSPSKGDINPYVSVERTSIGYMQAGASALSILTDKEFFGGSNDDLVVARRFNFCPILRKEFIIDEYQIVESKSIGADAILLIAAVLNENELQALTRFAHSLQLEVLIEVHDESELDRCVKANSDLVGVNNRNLRTFEVDLNHSIRLAEKLSGDVVKIAESGIDSATTAAHLRQNGFDGFLIGERFMKTARPEIAAGEFIKELNQLEAKQKSNATIKA